VTLYIDNIILLWYVFNLEVIPKLRFLDSFPEPEITGAEIVAVVLRRQVFLDGQ
jgi:hypothetical protein